MCLCSSIKLTYIYDNSYYHPSNPKISFLLQVNSWIQDVVVDNDKGNIESTYQARQSHHYIQNNDDKIKRLYLRNKHESNSRRVKLSEILLPEFESCYKGCQDIFWLCSSTSFTCEGISKQLCDLERTPFYNKTATEDFIPKYW